MILQSILKPADVLVVRTSGFAADMIRLGAALTGKPNLDNHVAVMHHWDGEVPWGLEGKPGGVGWVDLRGCRAGGTGPGSRGRGGAASADPP